MPRTGGALTVKSDERSAVGRGPASRSSNDGALGDRLGGELPADAAQVIAVEQIGLAVLPKREDQSLGASTTGRLERKRVGAAEIGIAGIERLPIRWSEEILRLARPPQVRRQAYYRLAVTPGRGAERVAGRHKQRFSVTADSARCPDAASSRACGP